MGSSGRSLQNLPKCTEMITAVFWTVAYMSKYSVLKYCREESSKRLIGIKSNICVIYQSEEGPGARNWYASTNSSQASWDPR
jgi:hypothetical protein